MKPGRRFAMKPSWRLDGRSGLRRWPSRSPIGHASTTLARSAARRWRRTARLWRRPVRRFLRQVRVAGPRIVHRHRWFVARYRHDVDVRVSLRAGELSLRPGVTPPPLARQGIGGAEASQVSAVAPATATSTRGSRGIGNHDSGGRSMALLPKIGTGPRSRHPMAMPRPIRALVPSAVVAREVSRRGRTLVPGVLRAWRPERVEDPSLATIETAVRRALPASPAPAGGEDGWPPPRRAAVPRASAGAATAGVPQVDVQQVTDQVMRRIDRRLVAWRERTGRV